MINNNPLFLEIGQSHLVKTAPPLLADPGYSMESRSVD